MKHIAKLQFFSRSNRALLALLSLVLLQAGAELAAADATAQTLESNPWAEVKMVDVAPVQRAIALLAPNAQTPPPPSPINPEQRLQLMAAVTGEDEKAPAPGDTTDTTPVGKMVLSAAHTTHEDKGVLTLVKPYTMHPETGIHFRGTEPGSVGVKVRVEEGGRYLLDFLVRSAVPGKYQLDTESGPQVIEDPKADREHVLLVLNAKSSGWTTVRLRRLESDFFLYAVEITRFEK